MGYCSGWPGTLEFRNYGNKLCIGNEFEVLPTQPVTISLIMFLPGIGWMNEYWTEKIDSSCSLVDSIPASPTVVKFVGLSYRFLRHFL